MVKDQYLADSTTTRPSLLAKLRARRSETSIDSVIVSVGATPRKASVTPPGSGGTGTCSIANSTLPNRVVLYGVIAAYHGDTEISAATTAVVATGLSVGRIAPSITVTNTSTSSVNLSLTATVVGTGTMAPSGTESWTVTINGVAYMTCSTSLTLDSGSSTAICTMITSPTMMTNLATASSVPGSDSDYTAAMSLNILGMHLGGGSLTSPTTSLSNFTVNASTAGSTTLSSSDQFEFPSPVTGTGFSGFNTPGFNSGTPTTTTNNLSSGKSTFATTDFTGSVTTASPGTTRTSNGSVLINASSGRPAYIDLHAQRLVSTDSFNGFRIVTFTQ